MTEQKEVWRVNTGRGVPSDFGEVVFYRCLSFDKVTETDLDFRLYDTLWLVDDCNPHTHDVTAYQTNRTKAAKYERVECEGCQGKGEFKTVCRYFGFSTTCKCLKCNAKGYTLEAIK